MAFDSRTYLRDVVNPLRDQPGGLPAADLARHYAVTPDMSAADIRDQLKRVRSFWQQRVGGAGAAATVCAQLLSRDEQLRAEHGDDMCDPAWWRDREAQYERESLVESQRFVDDLRNAYGAVGRVTREQLDAIARHWPGLSERGVNEAVRRAGLQVVERVELPTGSGMDRNAYNRLSKLLDAIGALTIVQLLHPERAGTPFTLLDSGAVPLDAAAVARQRLSANTVADSSTARSRKEALGLLQTAVAAGVDLRTLALFQIVERLQAARRQNNLPDGLLVRKATDVGLALSEAQSVVMNLPASQAVDPAQRIRELVEGGQLHAAQQALSVLPTAHPERSEMQARISEQLEQVGRLRSESDAALRDRREEEAEALLRAALRIAADDEDLERRLATLPPPPPRHLLARPRDNGVRLSWSPPHIAAGEVRYRVVRSERPPRSPGDGEVVAEGTEPEATDMVVPPARELHYGVFAALGRDWSRPATTSARVLPPVSAVRVRAQSNEIACSWRTHPAAESVRVRRTVGRAPASEDDGDLVQAARDGLYDDTAGDLADRFYGIVAVYRDEHGAEATAAMVVARATVRDEAPAFVEKLRVHATALDAQTAVAHIAWLTPASGRVSVRRSTLKPNWAAGTTVSRTDMDSYGEPLIGDRLVHGPETQVEATVPSGRFVYVPFTIDDAAGAAVVGEPVTLSVTEPVSQLLVRRTGTEASVSWVWPASVTLVELTFTPAHGKPVIRRMTRGQVAESGCRIPVGSSGGQVSVRGVSRGQDGIDTFSAPQSATVDGVAAVLEYHLERVGGMLSRGKRLLRVSVDQPCEGVELQLVAAAGPAMPARPDGGGVVAHVKGLTLVPGTPWEAPFTMPSGLSKPYWLRCFVTQPAGIRVMDPIDEMKVS